MVKVALRNRHFVDALAINLVCHTNRNFFDAGEHVELGEHEVGEAVDARRVAGDRGVIPTTAARAAGGGAVFVTGCSQLLAPCIEKLGWERACTNAGCVSLDDADNGLEFAWADARTRGCSTGGCVRRSYERVGSVVDVEHGCLATLEEHVLAGLKRFVQL